ncbi:alpha/beta hydrolase [Mycobacterium sp. ITM-2016-00317]|uniref:alpha/beta fold hydrolase n=1 Tax=Mycobacterium sp. ITM-2016-00317 TaxID=2099694 RepID=UPI000D473038|nr:alpha/beta hydrolase [Mycobacterium sp. ITM-2016-00317]WNG87815.1 alpha/beta hydrolase [Mycobacterium sp. ITM-2016-00317]
MSAATPAPLPFNHGRDQVITYPLTAKGIRTRVVESEGGETPLICLHGVGSRADRFIPVIPALVAAGFHIYAIDFPGHGLADKTESLDYRPRGFADFVAAVLDELGLTDVVIAGTSLGGHVSARIACDRPDLVKAVVLIGTMGISELPEENKVAPENVSNGSQEAVRSKLGFLVSDPQMVTDAWVREESMINSSAGAAFALSAAATALNSEANLDRQDARLRSERPDLPVLIVWGAEDRWTPLPMGEQAHELLPGSHFAVMPGCGHAPYFEDPPSFAEIVSEFAIKEGIR